MTKYVPEYSSTVLATEGFPARSHLNKILLWKFRTQIIVAFALSHYNFESGLSPLDHGRATPDLQRHDCAICTSTTKRYEYKIQVDD